MTFLQHNNIDLSIDPEQRYIEPDILLGCSDLFDLMNDNLFPNRKLPSGLKLIYSKLGYLIAGSVHKQKIEPQDSTNRALKITQLSHNSHNSVKEDSDFVIDTIDPSVNYEFTGSHKEEKQQQNKAVWNKFKNTIERRQDGYYVRFPWKNNAHLLPDNKSIALKRLATTVTKLKDNPNMLYKYDEIIKDQLEQGIIEESCEEKELLDWSRHNQLKQAQRTIAYVLRFIKALSHRLNQSLRNRIENSIPEIKLMTNNPYITATEHNLALRVLVRNHQNLYHATIPRNQNHLNLYKDQYGILRCKGRLGKADIPFNTQQPILIANNTKLAKIIIHDNHLPYHCSTGQTMAN
ncbi:hypothetical protein DICVIV_13919, partial [Dictyocaulus viviparus]